jgi:hypothetical protein
MPRLAHPESGGEFDAPDRAVPLYLRSGWTVKDSGAGGGQPAGKSKPAAGTTAEVTKPERDG